MTLTRRTFLTGSGWLAGSQLLAACSSSRQAHLRVRLLKDSIPALLLQEFRSQLSQPAKLDFVTEKQLAGLFQLLQTWQRQPQQSEKSRGLSLPFNLSGLPFISSPPVTRPDLVTMGDYWLPSAIQQGLIQPLDLTKFASWQQLPERWRSLVRRDRKGNPSASGEIWGAPYRWGTTLLVYQREAFQKLGWTPTDWGDLWRPELKGRISLLDQPREIIGLVLKKLGHSYNSTDLNRIANLKAELTALHQQAKLYSNDTYLQPLLLEDTWLAVAWSADVLPLLEQGKLGAVIPNSGTALWADLWVRPADAPGRATLAPVTDDMPLVKEWIEFCWRPRGASQLSALTSAASPMLETLPVKDFPAALRQNPILNPDPQVLNRSECLEPLPETTRQQYAQLWHEVRSRQVDG